MPLVSTSIPNLINGVSQQPATLRQLTQCDSQINGVSSVVDGLLKRPPTEHVAKISSSSLSNAAIHVVNRDTSNQYIIVVTSDNSTASIVAYDLNGNAVTVNTPNGTSYLVCSNPSTDLEFLTVADFTFIINKKTTVTMNTSTTPGSITDEKNQFSQLPTSGLSVGDIFKIIGDPSNEFDEYYVKATSTGGDYEETVKPGITFQINNTTMPHKLALSSGSFTFDRATYDDRTVGDLDSAPDPSFVGQTINGVFFHKNRLGFISDENVIFSRAGDFFNFFPSTVTALLDDSPIDVTVSHTSVSILKRVIPYNESLLFFSDKTQFILESNGNLTPETISITATTEFEVDTNVQPVGAGNNVYFAYRKGAFTNVREYFVDEDNITKNAANITAHVPQYIPNNVKTMVASNSEDSLYAITSGDVNRIYVYRWYFTAGETTITRAKKALSAWSFYELSNNDTILNIDLLENTLYLIVARTDGVYIEKMELQYPSDTGLDFNVRLDRKTSLTGSYNSGTNITTWTLPYPIPTSDPVKVVKSGAWASRKGVDIPTLNRTSTTTVTATGNYSASASLVGIPYTFTYQFSQQHVKEKNATVTVNSGRLQLRTMSIDYEDTGHFVINVTPKSRTASSYEFNGIIINEADSLIEEVRLDDGTFRFPILSKNDRVTISITSDSYLPCAFQKAEWEGFYTIRSQRI
jgi:hypothetical protein|tara:strand:+ start:4642 stop:6720 length:2079 start_codon:yes stop_codon:yes gene_type:complete